jgi:hypothetical protein
VDVTGYATPDRVEEIRMALEQATDEAWARYKDWRETENSSATYREGFADGLERALLIVHRQATRS